jgi:hypothetical protein
MKRYKRYKEWVSVNLKYVLSEELRLSDLQAHAGISDFTKFWKDERLKRKGAANKSAKLIKVNVDKKEDHITFTFYSSPTYTLTGGVTNPDSNMSITKESPWYTQEIRILDFFKWADTTPGYKDAGELSTDDLKKIFRVADVQVWCNDPSFHWQGDNFIISQFNASIHPTNIAPKVWNKKHNNDNYVCKHLSMLLASINFWLSPMASMLNKFLKEH